MSRRAVSIPDTEVHPIRSSHVEADFELWIARPQRGFAPPRPGPVRVLYLLDANLFFGTATEMTRLMHKLYGELPALHVVGIAYPTDDMFTQGALRTRDFTPSEDRRMAEMAANFPQPPAQVKIEPAMGGASAFLRFMKDEVGPLVGDIVGAPDHESILFGSSLGGLFATHVFLHDPTAFDRYIAVSPALWWNGDEALEAMPAIGEEHRRAGLYLAVGGLEESPRIPALAPFKMVTNARTLAERLERAMEGGNGGLVGDDPDLDAGAPPHLTFELLEGESHTSVVPVALCRGLRTLVG